MATVAYWNGEFLEHGELRVPAEDRGHLFGDGVYEVVRVYGGRPFLLPWHLERLERSLSAIGLSNPHSPEAWTSLIGEAVRRSGEAEATVYWQVTRGSAPRDHAFPAATPNVTLLVRPYAPRRASPAASAVCLPDERWPNVWVKTLNLLPNVIAKETAHRAGADEALLVRGGIVTEGSASNAWFVREGVLYTHPANRHILAGITRRFVLKLAEAAGIPVREQALNMAELPWVDEVFFTGTTVEIQPVGRILANREELSECAGPVRPDAPGTLVRDMSALCVLWERRGDPESGITGRLRRLFDDALRRFRDGEELE
ncbi:MAG: aminotransferase class IV [Alicyclobacillus sp.]|nr:aminotransferase class IV [Alicyclobacillus sp.]